MKVLKNIVFLFLISSIGLSCKKIVEGFDKDPNRFTSASTALLLNSAQVSSILINEGNLVRIGGIWDRSFTGIDRQYVSTNNYNTSSGDYDSEWDNLFQGVITQFRLTEDAASEVNDRKMLGIAQIGRAQHEGLAADLWGDVPFDQVGRDQDFPTPEFEPQLQVYSKVQTLLDSAIANLESGT
ncbi:MAG: SusD/RagB family nutrient-binding outer membrane lipoprotein, partial [Ginsengibacter sp.]